MVMTSIVTIMLFCQFIQDQIFELSGELNIIHGHFIEFHEYFDNFQDFLKIIII